MCRVQTHCASLDLPFSLYFYEPSVPRFQRRRSSGTDLEEGQKLLIERKFDAVVSDIALRRSGSATDAVVSRALAGSFANLTRESSRIDDALSSATRDFSNRRELPRNRFRSRGDRSIDLFQAKRLHARIDERKEPEFKRIRSLATMRSINAFGPPRPGYPTLPPRGRLPTPLCICGYFMFFE
jgi:hypothetical protein